MLYSFYDGQAAIDGRKHGADGNADAAVSWGHPLDVCALPAGHTTPEQNEFRLGLTVASQIGGNSRLALFFATEYWHFGVLAAPEDTTAPAAFRDALAAHFGYTGVSTARGKLP